MKRKRRNRNAGETVVETIISLLVIAMGLAMLPGAILTAARINREVAEQEIFPDGQELDITSEVSLRVTPIENSTALGAAAVQVYHDGDYYYFKK